MWSNACLVTELTPGEQKLINCNNIDILLINDNDNYYAIENRCSHQNLPLIDGMVESGQLSCPFHGAIFCLKSGNPIAGPSPEPVLAFATRVYNGWIQINI